MILIFSRRLQGSDWRDPKCIIYRACRESGYAHSLRKTGRSAVSRLPTYRNTRYKRRTWRGEMATRCTLSTRTGTGAYLSLRLTARSGCVGRGASPPVGLGVGDDAALGEQQPRLPGLSALPADNFFLQSEPRPTAAAEKLSSCGHNLELRARLRHVPCCDAGAAPGQVTTSCSALAISRRRASTSPDR